MMDVDALLGRNYWLKTGFLFQIEFFESGSEGEGCNVMDGDAGVLFVKKHDGRATGDAFVMFATEDEGTKGLAKHREIIGSRYIELFRSTTAEVQQVRMCSSCFDGAWFDHFPLSMCETGRSRPNPTKPDGLLTHFCNSFYNFGFRSLYFMFLY